MSNASRDASPSEHSASERLDSWKEIAAYLRRGIRSVQRWEKDEALPVHRHAHDQRGTVYAYKPELDAWWNNRREHLERSEQTRHLRLRYVWTILSAAALVAVAGVGLWLLLRTPPSPTVLGIHQVTHTGHPKARRWAFTDGARVYFTDVVAGRATPMVVPAAGGDAVAIRTTLEQALITGITTDDSELIVESPAPSGRPSDVTFWRVPVVGGSARHMDDSQAGAAVETADGPGRLYSKGSAIYFAKADGTGSRKLLTAPGECYGARYSPDGKRLRFTSSNAGSVRYSIWEASPDGSNLRRFLPAWNREGDERAGNWTPDGEYFVFEASVGGRTGIWALRESGLFGQGSGQPV